MKLSLDSTISLLGLKWKESNAVTLTCIFIAVQITRFETCNWSMYLLTEEWIRKCGMPMQCGLIQS